MCKKIGLTTQLGYLQTNLHNYWPLSFGMFLVNICSNICGFLLHIQWISHCGSSVNLMPSPWGKKHTKKKRSPDSQSRLPRKPKKTGQTRINTYIYMKSKLEYMPNLIKNNGFHPSWFYKQTDAPYFGGVFFDFLTGPCWPLRGVINPVFTLVCIYLYI